jgi:hypothetical protein
VRGDKELNSIPLIQNILGKINDTKMLIIILLISGGLYALLYSYFSNILLPPLYEWKDFQFHYRLITMIEDQSGYIPYVDGRPVLYPILFHHCVGGFSALFNVSIKSGMVILPLIMWTGSTMMIYLLIRDLTQNEYAGIFPLIFLGGGATVIILSSGTVFFGKAFIFPINYVIAGFMPHIMGHFFGLLLLYFLITTGLKANIHIIFGGGIGALLILTHFLAAVTYAIAIVCLWFSDHLTVNFLNGTRIVLLVAIAVLLASPWWGVIMEEFLEDPYSLLISDASKTWEGGIVTEMINYYGFIPLFSLIGTYFLIKSRSLGIFLFLWSIFLFILIFSRIGARFALECALPLYMLGGIGITHVILWIKNSKMQKIFRISIFIVFLFLLCDSLYIFKLF